MEMPMTKFLNKCREGRASMLSHPSGRPALADGNGTWRSWIWSPDLLAREMIVLDRVAWRGVVIIVTIVPWWASSLAMSIMGIRWPCAKCGSKTKWGRSLCCEDIGIWGFDGDESDQIYMN